MSHLPLPSELGHVALETFRSSLLPNLPPEAQYEGRMVLRALEYALSQTDAVVGESSATAQNLAERIRDACPVDDPACREEFFRELENIVAGAEAKVRPLPKVR